MFAFVFILYGLDNLTVICCKSACGGISAFPGEENEINAGEDFHHMTFEANIFSFLISF